MKKKETSKRFGANKFKVPRNAKYQEDFYQKHFRLLREKGLLKIARLTTNINDFAQFNVDFNAKKYTNKFKRKKY